jgi:hypothetical protein
MNINEVLSSNQQVSALELAIRSLPGGDVAVDNAIDAVLAEAEAEAEAPS